MRMKTDGLHSPLSSRLEDESNIIIGGTNMNMHRMYSRMRQPSDVLKIVFTVCTLILLSCEGAMSEVSVNHLQCEYLDNPLGIDTLQPRFNWRMSDTKRTCGQRQTAYRILVSSSLSDLERSKGNEWDTGELNSNQSVNVTYKGMRLKSGMNYFWKVKIWDMHGNPTKWSSPARFSIGLLSKSDWKAHWIGMENATDLDWIWFRKSFKLKTIPKTVFAYVGSVGFHELYVNGKKVGDQVLTPSVSDLQKRALYLTYDITKYLRKGDNAIGIWLAPGWSIFQDFNPFVQFHFDKSPLCICQVNVLDRGNQKVLFASDTTWKCHLSNGRHIGKWQNSDYGGDYVDARTYIPNWSKPGLNEDGWNSAEEYPLSLELAPDNVQPNRICNTIHAQSVSPDGPGKYRVVMQKLYTGWIHVRFHGNEGDKVTFLVSSLPNKECEYNQKDEYVIGTTGEGVFQNRFTYHECQYITIEGLHYEPQLKDITGYQISNDRKRVGFFDCSDKLLKKIYDITLYNYMNLSTGGMTVDCPHRERLGYGGDGHTSMEAALMNYDTDAFFTKWARDWRDIQKPDGSVAHTAPQMGGGGGPAWSGFIITMPWETYMTYGDTRILSETYPFMKRLLDYFGENSDPDGLLHPLPGGYWFFLGDWLTPHGSELSDSQGALLFNNCYYLYVTRIMSKIAKILGHSADTHKFNSLADRLKVAINKRFYNPEKKCYLNDLEDSEILPLISDAVPKKRIQDIVSLFKHELIDVKDKHLDTGLHGTYFMTKYLTEHGYNKLVYDYASQTTYPSYGYLINQGYTTWPEEWQGADSRMHGCFNGIGAWFQKGLAGIRPDPKHPGFQHFLISPAIVGDLKWVKAEYVSPYGKILSEWSISRGKKRFHVLVPPNSDATLRLPAKRVKDVLVDGNPVSRAHGVQFLKSDGGYTALCIQSGEYDFTVE